MSKLFNDTLFSTNYCLECDKELTTNVRRHIIAKHMPIEQYVLKWSHRGTKPKCFCGCGEETRFFSKKSKFNNYVFKHQYNDLDLVERMKQSGREAAADPEKNQKITEKMRALWQDPDYRDKTMATRHDPNSAYATTRNENMRKKLQDPEMIERARIKRQAWWDKTENKDRMKIVFASQEFRQKVSETTKLGVTPKGRKKMSETAIESQRTGKIGPHQTKRSQVTDLVTGNKVYLHSGWELDFYNDAKENDIDLCRDHNIKIEYTAPDGIQHNYIPDFFSSSLGAVFEIKGRETEHDICKREAAELWCRQNNLSFVYIDSKNVCEIFFSMLTQEDQEELVAS